jgi:6-pyruvoyltetrahydropterin/6-carboxytetrahydropterin synthase
MINKSNKIRVTKVFTFDMAHALFGYDGPCKNIHGHTYRLSVTLIGEQITDDGNPKQGMVIDFTDFKKIVKEHVVDVFDHTLVLKADTPHAKIEGLTEQFERVIFSEYQPSCENLLLDMVDKIYQYLPTNVQIHNIRLEETPTSYAEWFASDNF